MTIDPEFLRDVQRKGWLIRSVTETTVIGGCPRAGCNLSVNLRPDKSVPETCRRGPDMAEVSLSSFDEARVALRDRRDELGLTIREVEEISGATTDHLAKAEKDGPSRNLNTQSFIEWANALGYEVVLRPMDLPTKALRYISFTRAYFERRKRRLPIFAQRRAERRD